MRGRKRVALSGIARVATVLFKSKYDASDRKLRTRGSQQKQQVFLSCSCKQSAVLSSPELCVVGEQAPPGERCGSAEHVQSDKIHMQAQTVTHM